MIEEIPCSHLPLIGSIKLNYLKINVAMMCGTLIYYCTRYTHTHTHDRPTKPNIAISKGRRISQNISRIFLHAKLNLGRFAKIKSRKKVQNSVPIM